jgi:hypothetical protein
MMPKRNPASLFAIFLLAVTLVFIVYSLVITPRMDSGVPEQGYRPPIQDQGPSPESKQQPFEKSNVPPAGR